MRKSNYGYASSKKLLFLLFILFFASACKKKNSPTPPSNSTQTTYASYFPNWSSLDLESPSNSVTVEDEKLDCIGDAVTAPLRFIYKGVSHEINIHTKEPITLPSGGGGITGWYFEVTVSQPGASFSTTATLGRFQDFQGDHYKLEFTGPFTQVFKEKRYIRRL